MLPSGARLEPAAFWPLGVELSEEERAAARLAWETSQDTGHGFDTLPRTEWSFLPLRTPNTTVGVLAVRLDPLGAVMTPDQRRLVEALAAQAALAQPLDHVQDGRWMKTFQARALRSGTVRASITGFVALPNGSILADQIEVQINISDASSTPVITPGAVQNGASFEENTPLAPGSLITLKGSGLAESDQSALEQIPWPKEFNDVQVRLGDRPLPLLYVGREQINAQAAGLLSRKQAQEADIATRDETLREQRRRLTQSQEQRGAMDVELAQKHMAAQNLRDRVQQKYHVNLDNVRSECITITYADEGPVKVQTLTPEEMAASGAGTGRPPPSLHSRRARASSRDRRASSAFFGRARGSSARKDLRPRASSGPMTPFGEVLVSGAFLASDSRAFSAAPSAFTWSIPNDLALVGMEVHVQGVCEEAFPPTPGKLRRIHRGLSNALDLVLGY